jgi:ABC-2 type transport system ATP-binding protein
MDDFAIKVENVGKTFKLPHEKQSSVKSMFISIFRRKKGYELQKALDDISFHVKKGEFFGIVGRNGSGKSTLLKLIAGIYSPTQGNITVNGQLTPFIELGVGFNPELTGRENVYLNGALLGFNRKEMKAMYHDIVSFAELKRFMDQKLKNYSSGMQVRLAFSIAIRAKSDILLIDEVLAVGDAAFQRKCFNYFNDLKKNKQTVVFVSHDMASVRKYCDRAILIDGGKITAGGRPSDVVPEYLKVFMAESEGSAESSKASQKVPLGMSEMVNINKKKLKIIGVRVENAMGKKTNVFTGADDNIFVKFKIKAQENVKAAIPGTIITNEQGEFISASNTKWSGDKGLDLSKNEETTVTFVLPNMYEAGTYGVSVNVVSSDMDAFFDWENDAFKFEVNRDFVTGAKTSPKVRVEVGNG